MIITNEHSDHVSCNTLGNSVKLRWLKSYMINENGQAMAPFFLKWQSASSIFERQIQDDCKMMGRQIHNFYKTYIIHWYKRNIEYLHDNYPPKKYKYVSSKHGAVHPRRWGHLLVYNGYIEESSSFFRLKILRQDGTTLTWTVHVIFIVFKPIIDPQHTRTTHTQLFPSKFYQRNNIQKTLTVM